MSTRPEMIIDPPVGPYSSAQDVQAWLDELATYDPHHQVDEAIAEARRWLATAKEKEQSKENDSQ